MKLSNLLKEAFDAGTQPLSKEQKKAYMESIAKYNQFKENLYRSADLREMAKNVTELVQMAESVALTENDDWFDNVTVQRNVKSLRQNVKEFNKTANEVQLQQQRLEALYEDIGTTLNRYFHIDEINVPKPGADIVSDGINEDDMRDRRKSQSVMGSGKSEVLKKIFDKFMKTLDPYSSNTAPSATPLSKIFPNKSQYTYEYGNGYLTFIVDEGKVIGATFDEDRVHDFLRHMQSKGFGESIFRTLRQFGTVTMLGYTTVVKFD